MRVPYVLRGGERFFDRPEIREARLLLRGAARADQDGDKLADAVRSVLTGMNWRPDAPPPGGTARERWESLAALVSLADDLAAALPEAGLPQLLAELDARAEAQHAPTVQGVTLASLHSAKGLEWDAVFLVGLTDTTLPIQHATTEAQIAEERRLLYVGITRARERLALSWALARSPGQRRGRRPSRFLDGLRPAVAVRGSAGEEGEGGPSRSGRRRAVRAAAGLAARAGRRAEGAAVRGVQRRHAGRDRRPASRLAGRAGARVRASARPSSIAMPSRCLPCSPAPTRATSPRSRSAEPGSANDQRSPAKTVDWSFGSHEELSRNAACSGVGNGRNGVGR